MDWLLVNFKLVTWVLTVVFMAGGWFVSHRAQVRELRELKKQCDIHRREFNGKLYTPEGRTLYTLREDCDRREQRCSGIFLSITEELRSIRELVAETNISFFELKGKVEQFMEDHK